MSYQVIEAGHPGPKVEVVGEFDTEGEAISYATGQQQLHRESKHLWFVRREEQDPSWVVDEDGLRRRPSQDELDEFFQ